MYLNEKDRPWEKGLNNETQTMGDVYKLWSPTLGDGYKPQKSNHRKWI